MKKALIGLGVLAASLSAFSLTSCGSSENSKQITIWVGKESADFYEKEGNAYLKTVEEFKDFTVKAVATDAGTNAGEMVTDNTKCGDIITVAHDNIGKLSQANKIKPIINKGLIDQIKADCPQTFVDVAQNTLGGSTEKQFFAVPYISQALILYYNKQFVSDEQAKTFEGLKAAGAAVGKKSYTVTGMDGFNFSFTLLAKNAETNTTTLRLYDDGTKAGCYAQGDDELALLRWAQNSFADPNGCMAPGDTDWSVSVKNKNVLAVIGGAWHYNAFLDAVGEENFGATALPTLTLSAADVEGIGGTTVAAGTKFQAGTFADCKCFLINGASAKEKYGAIQALLKYFSSKEVQNRSFKECNNLPAYKGADAYINSIKSELTASAADTASAQIKMMDFGMPQPFVNGTLNTLYYSTGAPDLYKLAVLNDKGAYNDLNELRKILYRMEYIWKKGGDPKDKMPATLPATI